MHVSQGQPPDPEPNPTAKRLANETVGGGGDDEVSEAWMSLLGSHMSPITVDMTSLVPCLEVRTSFSRTKFHVDEEVTMLVKIRLV